MIKIGTDFSGIGSPEQAIKNLGIPHTVEFACEIDKHARNSYQAIHQCKIMYEDITQRNHSEVPELDLYVAGFPCQAFSMAGKRLGFEDVRGTLFFNVAEFIKINQPKAFILENVKGLLSHDSGRTFQTITDLLSNCGGTVNGQMAMDFFEDGLGYHIYYQVLNSKEHGIPHNRERIFIVGFKNPREYRFPLPQKLKKNLIDILEKDVGDKYYLSDKTISTLYRHKNPITSGENPLHSSCIHAGYYKMGGRDQQYVIDKINNETPLIGAIRGRKENKTDEKYQQLLEINYNGICNSLTSVHTDNLVLKNRIRRLIPLECWRLQGFPDKVFYKAEDVNSDTQLYKQAGNTITVNVIEKVIKNIYK